MRMSPSDLADVSAQTYTYLMNGTPPAANWSALFRPDERVRLRFINASAMTFFDVRIPGLKMMVVAADGQRVEPVSVDEIRIGVAETYDVIVTPGDEAYTLYAQSMDRSGFARGTLAPRAGMAAEVPALDKPEPLSMSERPRAITMAVSSWMHRRSCSGHMPWMPIGIRNWVCVSIPVWDRTGTDWRRVCRGWHPIGLNLMPRRMSEKVGEPRCSLQRSMNC